MTTIISHIGIGIIVAEILLRLFQKKEEYKDKRVGFWTFGLLGGLAPDLDFIPALLLGKELLFFHHFFTHTILAIILILIIIVSLKFNLLSFIFFIGYISHLFVDFLDNSLTPFSPFFLYIDNLGFLSSIKIGLDLNLIFMRNGWGWDSSLIYISYYDFILILITIPLVSYLGYLFTKRTKNWISIIK